MRYHRTTGLALALMQELTLRVSGALLKPWNSPRGRERACGLRKAVVITCMYIRHNSSQEFLADLSGMSQSAVSRIICRLAPVVKKVLEEFVPSAADAIEVVNGRVCLVDGTITPCWSWREHQELRSRKHGTTGFNAQVICLLDGSPVFISDPLAGSTHDAVAFTQAPVSSIVQKAGGGIADKGYQGCGMVTPRKRPPGGRLSDNDKKDNAVISGLRSPVERVIAHFKSWRMLHTGYRRPHDTYQDAYGAARELFFFHSIGVLNNLLDVPNGRKDDSLLGANGRR